VSLGGSRRSATIGGAQLARYESRVGGRKNLGSRGSRFFRGYQQGAWGVLCRTNRGRADSCKMSVHMVGVIKVRSARV